MADINDMPNFEFLRERAEAEFKNNIQKAKQRFQRDSNGLKEALKLLKDEYNDMMTFINEESSKKRTQAATIGGGDGNNGDLCIGGECGDNNGSPQPLSPPTQLYNQKPNCKLRNYQKGMTTSIRQFQPIPSHTPSLPSTVHHNNCNNNNNNMMKKNDNKYYQQQQSIYNPNSYQSANNSKFEQQNNDDYNHNNNGLLILNTNPNNNKTPTNNHSEKPQILLANLIQMAKQYYDTKVFEIKTQCDDHLKLQNQLQHLSDEFEKKVTYLQSIPVRYTHDIQKAKRDYPKPNVQSEVLNTIVKKYTDELENAKKLVNGPLSLDKKLINNKRNFSYLPLKKNMQSKSNVIGGNRSTITASSQLGVNTTNDHPNVKFQSKTFGNNINGTNKNHKKSTQIFNNNNNLYNNKNNELEQFVLDKTNLNVVAKDNGGNGGGGPSGPHRLAAKKSSSRYTTGKFNTSKSKLTNKGRPTLANLISRLRMRAREEFRAKVNTARDSTRNESDFANSMKVLRDQYYNTIQKINKIPNMTKELGMKYVKSLQQAQSELKEHDPELEDLLTYLCKEHIQN